MSNLHPEDISASNSRKSVVNLLVAVISVVFTMAVIGLISRGGIIKKIKEFHRQILSYHKLLISSRWPEGSYQYDDASGFRLTPSYSGKLTNGTYYLKTHNLGYRIPEYLDGESFEPGGILSVGCSFTFGDEVEAEETFSYITAANMNMQSYNYGVCSYSYASVIRQLEELSKQGIIKKLRPSIILLGAGDWLVERSLNPFYPTVGSLQFGYPFIGKSGDQLQIIEPNEYYSTKHLYKVVDSYVKDGSSKELSLGRYLRWLSISPRVSKANLDYRHFKRPNVSSKKLYDYVIGEIIRVLGNSDVRVVILWMPISEKGIDPGLTESVKGFKDVLLVDGSRELERSHVAPEQYLGRHPSVAAHAAYARALSNAIKVEADERVKHGIHR